MSGRVLLVTGTWPNPSETFLVREIKQLARLGLEFDLLSVGHSGRETPTEFRELEDRVSFLPGTVSGSALWGKLTALAGHPMQFARLGVEVGSTWGLMSGLALRTPAALRVAGKLRQRGYARVHGLFAGLPGAVAWMLGRWLDTPFSFACHARDIYVDNRGLGTLVRDAVCVVTCTEHNRAYLREQFPLAARKVHRVYHGVPGSGFERPENRPAPPLVLSVGRLVEKKGFATLMRACTEMSRRGLDYRCEIIGSGPLEEELKKSVVEHGLESRVKLTGWLDSSEVRRRMSESACLVAPSVIASDGDRDGIPNVMLEAMVGGCPVVAGAVSGIPEVVTEGVTGRLAQPGDPQSLARAITEAITDREGSRRMAQAAKELVRERFDPERNAGELLKLLGSDA